MAQLRSVRFNQVVLGELRVVLIGPAPRASGRFTFMDADGTTYGSTVFTNFSAKSHRLLQKLRASMEEDLVTALAAEPPTEEGGSNIDDDPEEPVEPDGLTLGG